MPPVGFEPMISAGERPQTYALDRAATGTDRTPDSTLLLIGIHEQNTDRRLEHICPSVCLNLRIALCNFMKF